MYNCNYSIRTNYYHVTTQTTPHLHVKGNLFRERYQPWPWGQYSCGAAQESPQKVQLHSIYQRICNSGEYTSGLSARFNSWLWSPKLAPNCQLRENRQTGIQSWLYTSILSPIFAWISWHTLSNIQFLRYFLFCIKGTIPIFYTWGWEGA